MSFLHAHTRVVSSSKNLGSCHITGWPRSENVPQSPGCPGVPAMLALWGGRADEVRGKGAYVLLRDRIEDEENAVAGIFGLVSSYL